MRITATAKYSVKKDDNFKTSECLPGTGVGRVVCVVEWEGSHYAKGTVTVRLLGREDSSDGRRWMNAVSALKATELYS